MLLHDELKSNHHSGLNQLKSSFEFKQLCPVINVFKLELSNLSRPAKLWIQYFERVYQRNTCGSMACFYKKNSIKCVQACGDCRVSHVITQIFSHTYNVRHITAYLPIFGYISGDLDMF